MRFAEHALELGVAVLLLFVLGLRADLVGVACGVGLLALGTLLAAGPARPATGGSDSTTTEGGVP